MLTKVCEWGDIEGRLNRFFFQSAQSEKTMAVCLRYRKIRLARKRKTTLPAKQLRSASERNCETIFANPLNVDEINQATKEIIRIVQRNSFVKEASLH